MVSKISAGTLISGLIFAPLKLFFSILSFLLLFLSCLPCGDREECNAGTQAQIMPATSHEKHAHEAEACTPFCSCSCCAASVHDQVFSKAITLKPVLPPGNYLVANDCSLSQGFSSIWQPPKVTV